MVTTLPNTAPPKTSFASETRADHEFAIGTVLSKMRADVSFPYTLDSFAEMANYSPFHFARLFRHMIGIPPGEFLAALRFERAKELILRTDVSITDICFEVGFSSLGTFSSRFKQLVGVSPAGLRALPEVLGPRLSRLSSIEPAAATGVGATMRGDITSPIPHAGHLFIGLFPSAIPQGPPISGTLHSGPGPFALHNVPDGMYRLMAALIPVTDDPIIHLLPGNLLLVGVDPLPVIVAPNVPRRRLHLPLRPLAATDPPILTALAPLALCRAAAD